ncbi:MAG TPA: energy transducer TonB [Bryobacteraceae bacterium]|nr:energy transducer TonB [Bryobacteraceae bacterium]
MSPAARYVWSASSRPLAIHLSLDVIQNLGLRAMEAVKAVPRRGLEIGGILLGRRETRDGFTEIFIDSFERVESEHRQGPSYLLSESDLERFDQAIRKHPGTVGVYRTHTRSEVLTVQEEDTRLFEHCFSSAEGVFLLIHPISATAAFFLYEQGTLVLAHEFPFHAGELTAELPAPALPARPASAAESRASESDAPPAAPLRPEPSASRRRAAGWALPFAAGVACAALATGITPLLHHRPPAATASPSPAGLTLNVQRDGKALHLSWNRNADTVRQASRATLFIDDGAHNSRLDLTPKELSVGTVSYWPETPNVSFRLEVVSRSGTVAGAIRVVGVPANIPVEASAPEPPRQIAESKPSPWVPPPARHAARAQSPVRQARAREEAESEPEPPVPTHPQAVPKVPVTSVHSEPAPVEQARLSPPPARPEPQLFQTPRHEPEPSISVVAEPVRSSVLARVVRKIPLLRRLKKKPRQPFEPPRAVRRVNPVLNAQERRLVTADIPIDVKVYVNDSGKVDYAELLSDANSENRLLASSALSAARRWDFTPARLGSENVPGQVILHFQFRPPLSGSR